LFAGGAEVALFALARGSNLDADLATLRARSVLIATCDRLTALAAIELDGVGPPCSLNGFTINGA
jgi:hypothetical protein